MPHKNGKKILGVPPMGSEPCLSEPKLGNVATALQGRGLLNFASKFNGTYMHMKWSFYSERNVALENVV